MRKITRRSALPCLSTPFLGALLRGAPGSAAEQTIARLELFTIRANHRGNWLIARITTAGGLTGIGDCSHGHNDDAVVRNIKTYFEAWKGRSVWNLESFRKELFPDVRKAGRNGAVAFGGLEQCCWDLRGKLTGRPVYDLLGGSLRPTIRNYANINRSSQVREPEAFAELATRAVAAGFDAIKLAPFDGMPKTDSEKMRAHTDRGVACVAAIRKAIGSAPEILVDGHSNFDLESSMALMRRLEPLRLYWLEEVTPKPADLARINQAASMQTAGGESLFGIDQFHSYIESGAVDIVMPDVKYCGGVWEMKKIAAIAEGAGLQVSPHGPASPVGNMISAHICATLPNCSILETAFGEVPWRAEVVRPAEQFVKGCLTPSERPGFGIELDEAAVERHRA